jgi:LTXXQ motif family protein
MVRSSAIALAIAISLGTLGLTTDADARGGGFGGGHFGGGFGGGFGGARDFGGGRDFGARDFGGGMRDFRPEMREPREDRGREIVHPEDHRALDDRRMDDDHRAADDAARRDDDHRADDADRRDDVHPEARDAAARRAADDRDLDHHDDLAHNWNNWHQPVNVGRWDHNGFWNNNWNARNFNCYNCRWGWVGPVFWPFGWGDMFSFAWWPYAATSPFWNYNVDYIMGGLFWPNGAYAWPSGGYGATAWTQTDNSYTYAHQAHQDIYSSGPVDGSDDKQAAQDDSQSQDLATCSGFAPGVSSLPLDKIEQSVKPTGIQLTALKSLETASKDAEGILKASCPSEPPLTPVGRLDALQKRLDAMTKGLDLVRAPLTKFDSSLSAEQKQELDTMGGGKAANAAGLCSTQNEEFTNVPTQEIEATVKPDEHQKAALDELDDASAKAASMLQATCPSQIPDTTEGRLEAMGKRLKATTMAMNEVRPALVGFYDSLSDEQKARFDTMAEH